MASTSTSGNFTIPTVVVWILGGVIGLFVLVFVEEWVRYKVSHKRTVIPFESGGMTEEGQENNLEGDS